MDEAIRRQLNPQSPPENLPDKAGEQSKWNFEKAHRVLRKVCDIVLLGNTDNAVVKPKRYIMAYASMY